MGGALTFYNSNIGKLGKVEQSLNVIFAWENGIDVGALKAASLTKIFEIARKKLFEHTNKNAIVWNA